MNSMLPSCMLHAIVKARQYVTTYTYICLKKYMKHTIHRLKVYEEEAYTAHTAYMPYI